MFTNTANSIAETSIIGSDTLFSAKIMITNTIAIEIAFTILKSRSVMFIRSFVAADSPIIMPFLSYFSSMSESASTCALTSGEATLYSLPRHTTQASS